MEDNKSKPEIEFFEHTECEAQYGSKFLKFIESHNPFSQKNVQPLFKKHIERELEIFGLGKDVDENSSQGELRRAIIELMDVFVKQNLTITCRDACRHLLLKLIPLRPLTPLTGEEDEWNLIEENLWQNKRYVFVFKDGDGNAFDCSRKVFRKGAGGGWYATKDSTVKIEFPYTPYREFIQLDEEGNVVDVLIQ